MRLDNLYTPFSSLSLAEQTSFIAAYRFRRASDLEIYTPKRSKRPVTTTSSKPVLTDEEKLLAKMLGLKQSDIIALRSVKVDDEISEDAVEDDTGLLAEDWDEESEVEGEA